MPGERSRLTRLPRREAQLQWRSGYARASGPVCSSAINAGLPLALHGRGAASTHDPRFDGFKLLSCGFHAFHAKWCGSILPARSQLRGRLLVLYISRIALAAGERSQLFGYLMAAILSSTAWRFRRRRGSHISAAISLSFACSLARRGKVSFRGFGRLPANRPRRCSEYAADAFDCCAISFCRMNASRSPSAAGACELLRCRGLKLGR